MFCCPGGTVHMVCRNKDRAEEAKSEIVSETGNVVSGLNLNVPYIKLPTLTMNSMSQFFTL